MVSITNRSDKCRVFATLVFGCLLCATGSPAGAQQDCSDGIINGSFGFNATITVCPRLASQAPGLQRELTQIAKEQGSQKDQIRELRRLINGLNSVSRNIGEQRQIELLRNFSAQIGKQQAAGEQQTQEQVVALAEQLDDLKNLLIEKLGNAGTRDKTTAAVDGPVGDAIAQFNLAKAHDLLEDIRVQLNAIDNKVDQGLKQEKDIKDDTAVSRQLLEQQEAEKELERKRSAEQQQQQQIDLETNPHRFAMVTVSALKPITPYMHTASSKDSPWQVTARVFFLNMQSNADPKLQIAFSSGAKSWLMNPNWDGLAGWSLNADQIGENAVLCLEAQDRKTGKRKQWTQGYTIQRVVEGPFPGAHFLPAGEPTLAPATGAPCGGATEVRTAAQVESLQEQIAKMQQGQQARLGQQSTVNAAVLFGLVDVSAKNDARNNGWLIRVYTSPVRLSTTLYDVQVQMVMKGAGNTVWPVQLSNRQAQGASETRYALVGELGTEAVVCFTARNSMQTQPMRMTKWYSIEASAGPHGNTAAFVPSREPTLEPASSAPCH
jgi:hypothetical protein